MLPPVRVVPLSTRCAHCAGVFRIATTWAGQHSSRYRRCLWCRKLTKLRTTRNPFRQRGDGHLVQRVT